MSEEDTDKAMDEIIKLKKEGEGKVPETPEKPEKVEGHMIEFKNGGGEQGELGEWERLWEEDKKRELKERCFKPITIPNKDRVIKELNNLLCEEQAGAFRKWAESNSDGFKELTGKTSVDEFSDEKLLAVISQAESNPATKKIIEKFDKSNQGKQYLDREDKLTDLISALKNEKVFPQTAGLIFFELEKRKDSLSEKTGDGGELKTLRERIQRIPKSDSQKKEQMEKYYKSAYEEYGKNKEELENLEDAMAGVAGAMVNEDIVKGTEKKVAKEMIEEVANWSSKKLAEAVSQKSGWEIKAVKGGILRRVREFKVIYETGKEETIKENDLREKYKKIREREIKEGKVKEVEGNIVEDIDTAYKKLRHTLIEDFKQREINKQEVDQEKIKELEIKTGGQLDIKEGLDQLSESFVKAKEFPKNFDGAIDWVNENLPENWGINRENFSDSLQDNFRKAIMKQEKSGIWRWIIDLLLGSLEGGKQKEEN